MKSYSKILIVIAVASVVFFGCGSDDKAVNEEEVQLDKLSETWVVSSVEKDNQPVEGYESFELTLSGSTNSAVYAYGVVGRPLISPWPSGGTWAFGSTVSSQITRDPATVDELDITYSMTSTTLEMDFLFNGTGYEASRVNSAEGHWVFTFSKK